MQDRTPYVYWVKNISTGMKYIGVRYAKKCHPNDLWVNYFTSSPTIHKLIDLYGKLDFKFKILHVFETSEQAILKELKYLKVAVKRKDYINFWHHAAPGVITASKAGKIGGLIQRDKKLGIHKQSKEERLKLVARARQIQIDQNKNKFINATKEEQTIRGKKGGVKNKGFLWYNDGINDFKYTIHHQQNLVFEKFIEQNNHYNKGRIKR